MLAGIAVALALQSPSFRASTRLVQVNVVVHDKNGAVADLTKDDFTITDRGKPQTIRFFSETLARGSAPLLPLPSGVFSNRPENSNGSLGSVTIVLLDALNTLHYGAVFADMTGPTHFENEATAYGKIQLMRFVKDLDPKDRVAIYALGKSLRVLCDFTNNPEQLQKVVAAYRDSSVTLAELAEPPPSQLPTSAEFNAAIDSANQKNAALANGDRASQTAAALMAIINHAADIPGRKNLVWLTASLPSSVAAIGQIASRANLAIYPVDARGLVPSFTPGYRPSGLDAMQEIADETGGRAFYNTNDLTNAIRKAVNDGEVSYTLGFYLDSTSLDGKFHELKIRVNRPGLDVRYPNGFFAVDDQADQARRREIRSALATPLESSGIHLLARVDRSGDLLRVAGSIDLRDLQLIDNRGAREGVVEIFLIQQDAMGNVLDQAKDRLTLKLHDAEYSSYLKSGILFRRNVRAKAGATTFRILAGDPTSANLGSLIIPMSKVK